jgi:superoxide dismutase
MQQDIRQDLTLIEASTRPTKLETTPLPYGEKDLSPVMSKESIDYHYEHLAKGYARRYNAGGDIKTIANHAVRTDICVLVDWWEHAWALDYQSDKEKYLDNIWKIIDWNVCNERL